MVTKNHVEYFVNSFDLHYHHNNNSKQIYYHVVVTAKLSGVYHMYVGQKGEYVFKLQSFFGVRFVNDYAELAGRSILLLIVQDTESLPEDRRCSGNSTTRT